MYLNGKFHACPLHYTKLKPDEILESCPEAPVEGAIHAQKVSHLAQVIDAKKALSLALGIRALKPRQPESSGLERTIGIRSQKGFDVWVVHLRAELALIPRSSFCRTL